MVLVFKQSLSVYRYSWVSGRGRPHLRERTCDDTPRENEEQANPEQKASGRKENKDCKKGQWVVENWEPGRKFSSPVERLSSAVLSKTLAISQRKDRSWAGSSRKTKTLFHWEAKVVDVRPSQKKVVFFLGSKSRRKLGEPEGWWYIQQEPWPRGLRDFEVRDKKEESLEEPMYWTRTTPRQGAVWGEWMTPPPPLLVLGPQRGCPAWPRAAPEGLKPEGAPAWEEEKVRESSDPMCEHQQQRQPRSSQAVTAQIWCLLLSQNKRFSLHYSTQDGLPASIRAGVRMISAPHNLSLRASILIYFL